MIISVFHKFAVFKFKNEHCFLMKCRALITNSTFFLDYDVYPHAPPRAVCFFFYTSVLRIVGA